MFWGASIDLCCLWTLVSEKLVLGSNDRGVHMYNSDEALKEKMKIACTRLNLTEHSVKGSDDLIAKTISVSHCHQLLATLSSLTTHHSHTSTNHRWEQMFEDTLAKTTNII